MTSPKKSQEYIKGKSPLFILQKKSKNNVFISHTKSQVSTQMWVVTHHHFGISALVSQTSFGGETSGSVAKCRLFSQAILYSPFCILCTAAPSPKKRIEGERWLYRPTILLSYISPCRFRRQLQQLRTLQLV